VFHRHDLLVIDPFSWEAVVAALPERDATGLLADWARQGWPVIYRRRLPGEPVDELPVAVQLPLSAGRRRVALLVPPDAVIGRPERPDIAAALSIAPSGWHATMTALQSLPGLAGSARVFGSLLWQCVTGLPYLREQSDLDLTFPCTGEPRPVAEAIAAIDRGEHPRIDGELLLPDGAACHWRELVEGAGSAILVKTNEGVELRHRDALVPV
jgi:phosphoribosyl-dephospho-CoA transferase